MTSRLEATNGVQPPTYSPLRAYAAASLRGPTGSFAEFVKTSPAYLGYVRFDDDGQRVVAVRARLQHTYYKGSSDRLAAMQDARAAVDGEAASAGLSPVTVIRPEYRLWESYAIQLNEVLFDLRTPT